MFAADLITGLNNNAYNDRLSLIYADTDLVTQKNRYIDAIKAFQTYFGDTTNNIDIEIYSAPGRTEIAGNHTDHQHGHVLAASIDLDAIAVVSKTDNQKISLLSDGYDMITIDLDNTDYNVQERETTTSIIKGILHSFKARGLNIGGFNAYVTSNVLIGAGLSSSAAFETLIGTILSGMYNNSSVSAVNIAIIGQYAENKYFGKPCGLMDQMACSVGGFVHINFADITHPAVEQIQFDINSNNYSLCIVDTKGSHADLTNEYAGIPHEMCEAAKYFGKEYLNEVDKDQFFNAIPDMMKILNHRCILRGIHFFNENERVINETNSLKNKDFKKFLSYVNESGNSSFRFLQNIYANNNFTNQPVSIALAASEHILNGRGVSRIHGGGFAGTILTFAQKTALSEYRSYMDNIFGEGACHILNIRNYGGLKVL